MICLPFKHALHCHNEINCIRILHPEIYLETTIFKKKINNKKHLMTSIQTEIFKLLPFLNVVLF